MNIKIHFDLSNFKVTSSDTVLRTLPFDINHAAFVVYFFCPSVSFWTVICCVNCIKLATVAITASDL